MNRYRVPQGRGAGFAGADPGRGAHAGAGRDTSAVVVSGRKRLARAGLRAGEVHQTATAGSFRYIGPLILRLR